MADRGAWRESYLGGRILVVHVMGIRTEVLVDWCYLNARGDNVDPRYWTEFEERYLRPVANSIKERSPCH